MLTTLTIINFLPFFITQRLNTASKTANLFGGYFTRLININTSLNPDSYEVPRSLALSLTFAPLLLRAFGIRDPWNYLNFYNTRHALYVDLRRIFRCRSSLLPLRLRFRRIRLVEFHYRASTTVKLVPRDFANYGNQGDSGKSRGYSRFLLSRALLVSSLHAQLLDETTSSSYISRLI